MQYPPTETTNSIGTVMADGSLFGETYKGNEKTIKKRIIIYIYIYNKIFTFHF